MRSPPKLAAFGSGIRVSKGDSGVDGQSKATRAAGWGAFGAVMALIAGSTPVGVAIVAALGAGLALTPWGRGRRRPSTGRN